jgi:hypothetical protein
MQQYVLDEMCREAVALQVRNNILLMDLKVDCETRVWIATRISTAVLALALSPAATVSTGRVK